MNAYCPECETDLDQATGICPACRWDPVIAAKTAHIPDPEPELSLTERYRGTAYDNSIAAFDSAAVHSNSGISRGRAFVIIALVAGTALYGIALGLMGPL